jgi:hypothetical protein
MSARPKGTIQTGQPCKTSAEVLSRQDNPEKPVPNPNRTALQNICRIIIPTGQPCKTSADNRDRTALQNICSISRQSSPAKNVQNCKSGKTIVQKVCRIIIVTGEPWKTSEL